MKSVLSVLIASAGPEQFHVCDAHDCDSHGNWAHHKVLMEKAPAEEWKATRELTRTRVRRAKIPSQEKVLIAQKRDKTGRSGGDSRGGAEDRRRRDEKLWETYGGPERGYVIDHASGYKMHYSQDPELNPNGYPIWEQGRIFNTNQGGTYTFDNVLPELRATNRARGSKPIRLENTAKDPRTPRRVAASCGPVTVDCVTGECENCGIL